MTRRQLLSQVDARELTEWAAYEQLCGGLGPFRKEYAPEELGEKEVALTLRTLGFRDSR